jgi:opacity protein-like surface antigen
VHLSVRSLLFILVASSSSAAAQTYVRGGVASERARDVTLRDVDCGSVQPPALFGCGSGADRLPFGARGDLRQGMAFEVALGRERGRARGEVTLAARSHFDLDAQANFTGVTGEQAVSARVRSLALVIGGAVDLAPPTWRVRPFVTAGAGIARNEIGSITFAFPGIGANAVTITRGGAATGFTWTAGVGVTAQIARDLFVDLTARHTDLGAVRGDQGEALIVRPTRSLELDIAATKMEWHTRGMSLSLRRRF